MDTNGPVRGDQLWQHHLSGVTTCVGDHLTRAPRVNICIYNICVIYYVSSFRKSVKFSQVNVCAFACVCTICYPYMSYTEHMKALADGHINFVLGLSGEWIFSDQPVAVKSQDSSIVVATIAGVRSYLESVQPVWLNSRYTCLHTDSTELNYIQ